MTGESVTGMRVDRQSVALRTQRRKATEGGWEEKPEG
jgi:hypothetical protein